MFTVNATKQDQANIVWEFQNISCLRLISLIYCGIVYNPGFQNISCLRLMKTYIYVGKKLDLPFQNISCLRLIKYGDFKQKSFG